MPSSIYPDPPPTALTDHLVDAADSHDATAISFTPDGSISATDVQAAIVEVRDEASGSGIPASIVDVKGDLIVATAADTVARLAAGTDGDVLTADSGATEGVAWATPTGGGAPTTADYLVGTADAGLSNEIAVGTTPGGELGGTWASPTVDATHSGSTHGAAVTTHEGLSDPHTGYRLESADHTHATTGAQGGTVAHTALTSVGANDHHNQAHVVTGADHTASGLTIGHVLTATSSSAFAFQAAAGGGDHGALTGLTDDDHTQYQKESEKSTASGYASLDAGTKVPIAEIPTGTSSTTVALGNHLGHSFDSRSVGIIASSDESKNSLASVADDAALAVGLTANLQYVLRMRVFFLTNATADLKYRLTFSGTTTRVRRFIQRTATTDTAVTTELKTAFDAADVVLSTTGLNPWLYEEVILQVGASGGTFRLRWSQGTSDAGPTTRLEGSYIEVASS